MQLLHGSLPAAVPLALVVLLLGVLRHQAEAKPHIILMVLDDVGRTDTGLYGESNIPTPRLNQIAKEGVIFDNFYVQPLCSPTRSSVLSGRYPFRIGMQHYTTQLPGMSAGIPLDVPILPSLLAKEGYERHAIGKWHVGYATYDHLPTNRGFQSFVGYLQGQINYFTHKTEIPSIMGLPENVDGYDFWENTRPYFEARGNFSVDLYQAQMTKVLRGYVKRQDTLEKQRQHPLFIYMAHQIVHIPIQYRQEEARCAHLTHQSRRKYCNMMVELDDAVGDMVDQLKSLGLWDNTIILTLTDNGGMVNFDPNPDGSPHYPASQGSNYPLRGSKMTLFEGGVRCLGFAAGGFIPKEGRGRRVKELAHIVDFSATILTLGGVLPAKKERLGIDGNNLFDLIANRPGATAIRDHVPINVVDHGKKSSAVRFGKYKYIIDDTNNPIAQAWFDQNGDLKEAAPPFVKGEVHLYDLDNDPYERKNIAKENPRLVKHAEDLLRSYVEGGNYMEPQESNRLYAKALPVFHGGAWKPFMSAEQWQAIYKRAKAKASRIRPADSFGEEEEVYKERNDASP